MSQVWAYWEIVLEFNGNTYEVVTVRPIWFPRTTAISDLIPHNEKRVKKCVICAKRCSGKVSFFQLNETKSNRSWIVIKFLGLLQTIMDFKDPAKLHQSSEYNLKQ